MVTHGEVKAETTVDSLGFRVQASGFRAVKCKWSSTPVMQNQMEKNMDNYVKVLEDLLESRE